jgi:cyclopropane fatty-acyl-phospholipid synthase-like methyltransferase
MANNRKFSPGASKMKELLDFLINNYKSEDEIFKSKASDGYWSNLSKTDQDKLFFSLKSMNTKDAIKKYFPQHYSMIYDPMRNTGLTLLDIKKDEVGVDYGCMWGNMLLYASKNCREMLGIDQTLDSLKFVQKRIEEENINNCYLLQADIKSKLNLKSRFDFAIVNGVLEWVPEVSEVELDIYHSRDKIKLKKGLIDILNQSPAELQHQFLCKVNDHLTERGRLYLAIENKFNYQYFLWKRDPHVNLFYTSFLPKFLSNLISYIFRGRPYRNYIYSKNGLKKLLKNAGFTSITSYAAFPSYQFPLKIIPIERKFLFYEPVYIMGPRKGIFMRVFRKFRRSLDVLIFNKLKLLFFVPAFIIIAEKEAKK